MNAGPRKCVSSDANASHLVNGGTNQVNQVISHPRTTFGAVIVNVNKRFVSADARAFTQTIYYVQIYFILNTQSKVKSQSDSNDKLLVHSLKV